MVACYSEGFLCLRPWDESILRAGMSIFAGIAGAFAFAYGNHVLLKQPEETFYDSEALSGLTGAQEILSSFHGRKALGQLSDTARDQIARLEATADRAEKAITLRFGSGSMAHDRYAAAVAAAKEAALDNCIGMANRMQMFGREYGSLQDYKKDAIPDDIQEKRIALYGKNEEHIREAIKANENLILALDSMSMELAGAAEADSGKTDQLFDEIEKLTEQVKLYA